MKMRTQKDTFILLQKLDWSNCNNYNKMKNEEMSFLININKKYG